MRTTSLLMLVVGFSVFCSTATALPVGYDWQEWPVAEGGNGHYYAFTEFSGDAADGFGNWEETQAEAANLGSHLVTINDLAEHTWVVDTFKFRGGNVYCGWIGLYQDTGDPGYSEPAGGWKWVSGEPFDYTANFFMGNEPNNMLGGENWGIIENGGLNFNDWGPTSNLYEPHPGIIEFVPEPTSLCLFALGSIPLLRRRR